MIALVYWSLVIGFVAGSGLQFLFFTITGRKR